MLYAAVLIDNSHRDLHALVDADLLASVYVELLGGRQPAHRSGLKTKVMLRKLQLMPIKCPLCCKLIAKASAADTPACTHRR